MDARYFNPTIEASLEDFESWLLALAEYNPDLNLELENLELAYFRAAQERFENFLAMRRGMYSGWQRQMRNNEKPGI